MSLARLSVFISWSGDRSRLVGEALRDWLPDILPLIDPFLSTEDIEKGAKWNKVISGALEQSDVAIICLTPENLTSPWLLFEAGAVAKRADSRVWTYLFGLGYTDVKDPLSQFQHTVATKEDTKKLIGALNHRLGEGGHAGDRLAKSFDTWWPQLELKLKQVPEKSPLPAVLGDPLARIEEMTRELLERVRESSRKLSVDPDDIYDDDDRIDVASIVRSVIVQQLKQHGIPFKAVATCTDGAFGIIQSDKSWRIEKDIGEDFALGRLTLTTLFARAVQNENPCTPTAATPEPQAIANRRRRSVSPRSTRTS